MCHGKFNIHGRMRFSVHTSDLNRIFLQYQSSSLDFILAPIPQSFDVKEREILSLTGSRYLNSASKLRGMAIVGANICLI